MNDEPVRSSKYPHNRHRRAIGTVVATAALLAGACGTDDGESATTTTTTTTNGDPVSVRLITHDSFNVSDDVLDAFETETGVRVEILRGGDGLSVVNQAILTAGNPRADVLFGIDNNSLAPAFEADLFIPYASPALDDLRDDVTTDPDDRVSPIDVGDVCVNYDADWFSSSDLDVPEQLEDLVDPAYAGLFAVQNPATSTPGLAFLLATVAEFGEDGYLEFWEALGDNDVAVTDGWEQAYYGEFSGGSGEGNRPLVVSYATSPPVDIVFSEAFEATGELPETAPTGVISASCYRQIEYAGILRGTDNEPEAQMVIDWLLSEEFQQDIPLTMYVEPARADVDLPEVFTRFSATPAEVLELPSDQVADSREDWVDAWRRTVLR